MFSAMQLAISVRLVLPITTAPASRSRTTRSASRSGTECSSASAPAVVGSPATSMLSLMSTGTPCSGPAPGRRRRSASSASARSWASGARHRTALTSGPERRDAVEVRPRPAPHSSSLPTPSPRSPPRRPPSPGRVRGSPGHRSHARWFRLTGLSRHSRRVERALTVVEGVALAAVTRAICRRVASDRDQLDGADGVAGQHGAGDLGVGAQRLGDGDGAGLEGQLGGPVGQEARAPGTARRPRCGGGPPCGTRARPHRWPAEPTRRTPR